MAYAFFKATVKSDMSARKTAKRSRTTKKPAAASPTPPSVSKLASLFRNGANQALRLPQDFRFPDGVKEVRIRKQGDSLLISPVRPDWTSFFALTVDVPEEFLNRREESPDLREPP